MSLRLSRGDIDKKLDSSPFLFYKDDDYKYESGVSVNVYKDKGELVVHTRTPIWRSKYDNDFHNYTIRQLRKRFGGDFRTDFGTNHYFRYGGPVREKAEAGCYFAFGKFKDNLGRVKIYLQSRNIPPLNFDPEQDRLFAVMSPTIVSNNLVVPFLVALLEDYFRSTYIALLKYSPKKASTIRNMRLSGDELISVSNGELSIEEAIAKWMSFQDIGKLSQAYKDLEGLDVAGVLRKPYRRRKESLYQTLERVINQRHTLIHRGHLNLAYWTEQLEKDVNSIYVAIERVYDMLISKYGWNQRE